MYSPTAIDVSAIKQDDTVEPRDRRVLLLLLIN